MSQLMEDDECNICMEYVAFIADRMPWTCEVCHLTEDTTKYSHPDAYNIIWGRYQLRCGHQAHIRCYRKWCKILGKIACPTCHYVIEPLKENKYCNVCMKYGHPTSDCEL